MDNRKLHFRQKKDRLIVSKSFKRYIRQAGLNNDLKFHSLRHTYASYLVQGGVSLYVVQKLLGHSDIKTTEIYAHLSPESLQEAVRGRAYRKGDGIKQDYSNVVGMNVNEPAKRCTQYVPKIKSE